MYNLFYHIYSLYKFYVGTKCIEIEVQISESDDDYKPPSVSVGK